MYIYIFIFYVSMLCFKTRDTFCVDKTIYLNIIDNDITFLVTYSSPWYRFLLCIKLIHYLKEFYV